MDPYNLLISRRTIHQFSPAPIDENAIDRALAASVRAPNHKLTNPWRFTRVGPVVREKLVDLIIELKLRKQKAPTENFLKKIQNKFQNPAALLVVSQVLDPDPFRRREDFAAVACAIQNLSLSLWSENIGSKWSTGSITQHQSSYELLRIDPDQEEIVGFIWIGIPAEIPDPPRLPLSNVVRTTE